MSNRVLVLILAVFGGVLLLLILITSLTSLNLKNKAQTPTPTPQTASVDSDSSDNIQDENSQKVSAIDQERAYQALLKEPDGDLTTEEKNLLDQLKAELPISTDDFEIAYDKDINRFIIYKKTNKADDAINSFLQKKGLSGLLLRGWGGFLLTNVGIKDAISEFKEFSDDMLEDDAPGSTKKKGKNSTNPNGKTPKTKDEKLLTDFGTTMLSFDFTKKEEAQSGGSGGEAPGCPGVSRAELNRRLLTNPLWRPQSGRPTQDVQNGIAKDQLVCLMVQIVEEVKVPLSPSVIKTGHSTCSSSGYTSNHFSGLAVDIGNEEIAPQLIPWITANIQKLGIDELIFSPVPPGTQTLKHGAPFQYDSGLLAAHTNHIHVDVNGPHLSGGCSRD